MVSATNDPAVHYPSTSSLATALLFGSIGFATAALAARTYLVGDVRAIRTAFHPKAQPLDVKSYSSLYTLLYHLSVFGSLLLFAFVCEYHPPFPHSEKSYDRDEFIMLTVLLFLASAFTVTRNDRSSGAGGAGRADKKQMERKMSDYPVGTSDVKKGAAGAGAASPDEVKVVVASPAPASTTTGMTEGEQQRQQQEAHHDGGVMVEVNLTEEDVNHIIGKGSSHSHQRRNGGGGGATTTTAVGVAHAVSNPSSPSNKMRHAPTGIVSSVKACNDVLNRDQTEEWKGWMQYMFLLYHYYHAEEMYNSIRIMITCYVWMTGFGNFSFFYLKDDYGVVRVLQMLWRLNFLVFFLCLSQGTTYILYYICPLHTYFFLMVYVSMRVFRHVNYSRYGLRIKLMVLAVVIYLMWDVNTGLFRLFHLPLLGEYPQLGAGSGTMWEWYFRSTLDHWSTFLGMIFAANYPIVSLMYRKLEAQSWTRQWMAKGAIGAALFAVFAMWAMGPFRQAKVQYNATNCYFGFVPLITYIFFRNLTPTLRSYSLDLLHQIGKTTLETYLMQHHIWLTSDAKTLLTLIPGWPKVNMVVVTVIYYLVSRRLYKLTLFLRGMLLPDDKKKCFQSLGCIALVIAAFYAMAYSMESIHIVSVPSVAVVSMLIGILLYQTVLDASWSKYKETSPPPADADPMEPTRKVDTDSPIAKLSPPLIGTMVLFILGLFWQGMALNGAGKVLPLPATCEASVNSGMWVPIDGCNEYQRGVGYRNHDTSGFAACTGSYVWGWHSAPSNSLCRFYNRSPKVLKKVLHGRRLVFVGDSMTRNVFHAFSRALGDPDGGLYDGTALKHSDISKEVGTISLEFKWAPLAGDVLKKLSEIRTEQEKSTPDMVLVGGGAWDRLHVWATDEDQKSLKITLHELAKEMVAAKEDLGIPTVWFNPTTINTVALEHEDKRVHMKEEDMKEMRDLYATLGVWSASSFVLDGTAFTKDRVDESYDGVHYPPHVYDAGAQILANAMDWVILDRDDIMIDFIPPQPGKMANPFLGLMMLCISFVGLFFFDAFLGFSYIGSIFVRGVMPTDLYEEAFIPLHLKMKLPPIMPSTPSDGDVELEGLLKGTEGSESQVQAV